MQTKTNPNKYNAKLGLNTIKPTLSMYKHKYKHNIKC